MRERERQRVWGAGIEAFDKGQLLNIPAVVKTQLLALCSQSINSMVASFPESNHDPLEKQSDNT